jgi:hypothetical protein
MINIILYINILILISYIITKILYFINNYYLNMIIIFISILIQIDNLTLNQDLIILNKKIKKYILLIYQLKLELHKEKIFYNELLICKDKINIINWKLLTNKFKLYNNLKKIYMINIKKNIEKNIEN